MLSIIRRPRARTTDPTNPRRYAMRTRTKPYPYQRHGVHLIQHRFQGRAILGDEMGLGKTPQAMWWARKYLKKGPIVAVVPANLKENWRREALKHVGMRAAVLSGRRPPSTGAPRDVPLVVINYDILGSPGDPRSWVSRLRKLKPGLVIVDESHYIKSRDALRTRAVQALARPAPHVLVLDGLGGMVQRPAEIWTSCNLVRPDLFPKFKSFGDRYCGKRWTPWGWRYDGATNTKELFRRLRRTCLVRRRKADVLKDLPAKQRIVVPIELDKKARREYDEALNNFLVWLAKYTRSPARVRRAMKAERMVRMGYLRRLAAVLKLRSVAQWAADYLETNDDKLILYGIHHKVIEPLAEQFGRMAVMIHGGVTGRKRQNAMDAFNRNPSKRLLVGQIEACGVGWSCTSTSTVAFAEIDWTPGKHVQAEDRVHGVARGLAGRNATAYYLVAADTIEEDLCRIIQTKQGVLDAVLDGEVVQTMDVLDQLMAAMADRGRDAKRRKARR